MLVTSTTEINDRSQILTMAKDSFSLRDFHDLFTFSNKTLALQTTEHMNTEETNQHLFKDNLYTMGQMKSPNKFSMLTGR